jgi:hypothetical protein
MAAAETVLALRFGDARTLAASLAPFGYAAAVVLAGLGIARLPLLLSLFSLPRDS